MTAATLSFLTRAFIVATLRCSLELRQAALAHQSPGCLNLGFHAPNVQSLCSPSEFCSAIQKLLHEVG